MFRRIAVTVSAAVFALAAGTTTYAVVTAYEDGSGRLGSVVYCLPGAPCQDGGTHVVSLR